MLVTRDRVKAVRPKRAPMAPFLAENMTVRK